MTRACRLAAAALLLMVIPLGCSTFGDAPDGSGVFAADGGGATTADASATDAPVVPTEPLAFVQVAASKAADANTVTVAFPSPVAAHHAIVLAISVGGGATLTKVGDTLGAAFTTVVGPTKRSDGANEYVAFASDVPKAGIESVAVDVSAPSNSLILYAHEYAGITAFESGAGAAGDTAGTISSPIVASNAARTLLFGFATSGNATAGVGFDARSTFATNVTEDRIVDGPGNYAAVANADSAWTILVAAFR